MQVKKQQLELDMEQWTSSKLGKEYVQIIYCHPAYLTYMQSTTCKVPGWMNHKLESRLLGEISTISDKLGEISITSDTTLMAESDKKLKSFMMGVKEESEKMA